MDAPQPEFEDLQHNAGARMAMGAGFPEEFVSSLLVQNTASSENDMSPVWARVQGAMAFAEAAKQMRRLFGKCGSAAREDVLVAADAGPYWRTGVDTRHR